MKPDKHALLKAEGQLLDAIKTGDIKILDALLHDDLRFIVPTGQTITKEMDLASHRAGHMIVERLHPFFEDVVIIGDTGIVIVVYETKGIMMGNPIEGKFRYIRVWKQFKEGVKVIGGSCTMI